MPDIYDPQHQLKRIWRMRDIRDAADGEYRVAVAMARHIGVPVEDVARRAGLTPEQIDEVVAELANEDIVELAEAELDWVDYDNGAVYIR